MQSKLPDINHALVTHRNGVIRARDIDDPIKAEMHLRTIVALLPKEFRVEISTAKYQDAIKASKVYPCLSCEKEIPADQVVAMDYAMDPVMKAITCSSVSKIWVCPRCEATNSLEQTEAIVDRIEDPAFHKIIPERPIYTSIYDRTRYGLEWKRWLQISMQEVEHQIGLYRAEYAAQQDDIEGEVAAGEGGDATVEELAAE